MIGVDVTGAYSQPFYIDIWLTHDLTNRGRYLNRTWCTADLRSLTGLLIMVIRDSSLTVTTFNVVSNFQNGADQCCVSTPCTY